MNACIGLDFGGVIVQTRNRVSGEDTSLDDPSLRSGQAADGAQIAQDGAFDAIRQIVSVCDGRVWIVSKAGTRMQARTLAWLDAVDFFARTGLQADHVRFCLKREDKTMICQDLGISHFVDDRVHVMQLLRTTVPHLYLFGQPGGEKFCPPWATFVYTWPQVADLVTRSVQA